MEDLNENIIKTEEEEIIRNNINVSVKMSIYNATISLIII